LILTCETCEVLKTSQVSGGQTSHDHCCEVVVTHIITATAGPDGSITPSGGVLVAHGEGISFFVFPDAGYETDAVFLDGRKVRLREGNRFDFINADRDHTLSVTFRSEK